MNLKKYRVIKTKINKFVSTDTDTWRTRMLFDVIRDEQYAIYLEEIIDIFNKIPRAVEVDRQFEKIRKKNIVAIEKYKKAKTLLEKYESYILVERYFGLLETLTELSSFSERIIEEISNKYGDDFLEIFKIIDNATPSLLTNFAKKGEIPKEYENDELIKVYLVLKKWQDAQFIFANEKIDPICGEIEIEFREWVYQNHVKQKLGCRVMYELFKVQEKNIILLDDLVLTFEAGLGKYLPIIIGGKACGLLSLMVSGVNIPKTYIIPVSKKIKFADLEFLEDIRFAVRSSADLEDGFENSFAGMFDSYLEVAKENLVEKVLKVQDSITNDRVKNYTKIKKTKKPEMAVIIQEYIEADLSGVWIGQTYEKGIIEKVAGSGEILVSGKINVETCEYSKGQNELADTFIDLQKKLNHISDFEWCIKDNQLYMLQFRPVTRIIEDIKKIKSLGKNVSNGVHIGAVKFIENPEDVSNFNKGDILVTWFTDPNWVSLMIKAGAIVTAVGGFLCHTAIIARELGLPCITSIGIEKIKELQHVEKILVDANSNNIYILGSIKKVPNILDKKIILKPTIYFRDSNRNNYHEAWNSESGELFGIDKKTLDMLLFIRKTQSIADLKNKYDIPNIIDFIEELNNNGLIYLKL